MLLLLFGAMIAVRFDCSEEFGTRSRGVESERKE